MLEDFERGGNPFLAEDRDRHQVWTECGTALFRAADAPAQ
jgi:hypothetical protein